MQHVIAGRRKGTYAYAKSGTLCCSALFRAGRFDDLLAVLAMVSSDLHAVTVRLDVLMKIVV